MLLTSHDTGLPAWVESLRPYLSNCDQVKICPVDPKGKERLENRGTSYILNEYVTPQAFPPEGSVTNLDALPRSSETITTFVVSDQKGVANIEDHTHSSLWVKPPHRADWANVLADITPDRFRTGGGGTDPRRSMEGNANYLYADSHVKVMDAKRVKSWIDSRFNFAKPPTE
jgi:prepilin-type processing-associated H-X9-DG protein